MLHRLTELLFPRKCVFCRKLLKTDETDLCAHCRQNAPVFAKGKFKLSFIARWTAVWYYEDTVRQSILRYKFGSRRSYAPFYGRQLAMKLQTCGMDAFDVLTYVPISRLRKWKRRFDQMELVAEQVGHELGVPVTCVLRKVRHNKPQSTLKSAAQRRANALNAYRVLNPEAIRGKRVLLLDDILTTGATANECARTLLTAGASEVTFAAIAVANHNEKKQASHPEAAM